MLAVSGDSNNAVVDQSTHSVSQGLNRLEEIVKIIGSKHFSSSCPPSAAIVTVTSLPMILKQTWSLPPNYRVNFTGMMEERLFFRQVDFTKARARSEDMRRRSLLILPRVTAQVSPLKKPLRNRRCFACRRSNCRPAWWQIRYLSQALITLRYSTSALIGADGCSSQVEETHIAASILEASQIATDSVTQASNSCPRRIGTASCI